MPRKAATRKKRPVYEDDEMEMDEPGVISTIGSHISRHPRVYGSIAGVAGGIFALNRLANSGYVTRENIGSAGNTVVPGLGDAIVGILNKGQDAILGPTRDDLAQLYQYVGGLTEHVQQNTASVAAVNAGATEAHQQTAAAIQELQQIIYRMTQPADAFGPAEMQMPADDDADDI